VAVDLPGHGLDGRLPLAYQSPQDLAAFSAAPSAVAGLTPDTAADAVAPVVRRAAANGPVVLVGHSLGGAVVSRTADRVGEVLDHLVYVSAVCASGSASVLDYLGGPEVRDSLLVRLPPTTATDPIASGVTRTNFRTGDQAFLQAFKASVYSDMPDEQFLATIAVTQQPDESTALNTGDARGDPARWGRVPRTFVRLLRDRSLPIALQDRWIREADDLTPDNRFATATLDAPHGAPLTHADDVAAALAALV
jgi:pimeloyl-ACP methyl ester carboxylesterase